MFSNNLTHFEVARAEKSFHPQINGIYFDLCPCRIYVTVEKKLVGPNVLAWLRAKKFNYFAPTSQKCGVKVNSRSLIMAMVLGFWLLHIGPNTKVTGSGHSCSSKNEPVGP